MRAHKKAQFARRPACLQVVGSIDFILYGSCTDRTAPATTTWTSRAGGTGCRPLVSSRQRCLQGTDRCCQVVTHMQLPTCSAPLARRRRSMPTRAPSSNATNAAAAHHSTQSQHTNRHRTIFPRDQRRRSTVTAHQHTSTQSQHTNRHRTIFPRGQRRRSTDTAQSQHSQSTPTHSYSTRTGTAPSFHVTNAATVTAHQHTVTAHEQAPHHLPTRPTPWPAMGRRPRTGCSMHRRS